MVIDDDTIGREAADPTAPGGDLRDRISGSLYGLLCGDALGCPMEGMDAAAIHATWGEKLEMVEPVGDGRWGSWRPRGLHSDDGQQALAVLDALLSSPAHAAARFGALVVEMLEQGPAGYRRFGLHRGTGANFESTVMRLRKGAAPAEAGNKTAGNGAAMRVAPVAMYFRDDVDAMLAAVLELSLVTHRDPRGIAAAGAVALVTRELLTAKTVADVEHSALLAATRRIEDMACARLSTEEHAHTFSDALAEALVLCGDSLEDLVAGIEETANGSASRTVTAGSGYACAGPVSAIALVLRGEGFARAVRDAVWLGDDTDTTAAMAGQMAGALYGRGGIPRRWLDKLIARATLEDRIDAVCARVSGFNAGFSLVELERPWTDLLNDGLEARGKLKPRLDARPEQPAPPPSDEADPFEEARSAEYRIADPEPEPRGSRTPTIRVTPEELAAVVAQSDKPDETGDLLSAVSGDSADGPAEEFKGNWHQTDEIKLSELQAAKAADNRPDLDEESAEEAAVDEGEPEGEVDAAESERPEAAGAAPTDDGESAAGEAPPVKTAPAKAAPSEAAADGKGGQQMTFFDAPGAAEQQADRRPDPGERLVLVRGDITEQHVDAIVNAANTSLLGGGGVDGAIHRAGGAAILEECKEIRAKEGGCKTGSAVVTGAGTLDAKWVIHAVGPRWRGGAQREPALLEAAYRASLQLAAERGAKTVAFPSISTGIYRFPLDRGARIALGAIADALLEHEELEVRMVLFNDEDFAEYTAARAQLFLPKG